MPFAFIVGSDENASTTLRQATFTQFARHEKVVKLKCNGRYFRVINVRELCTREEEQDIRKQFAFAFAMQNDRFRFVQKSYTTNYLVQFNGDNDNFPFAFCLRFTAAFFIMNLFSEVVAGVAWIFFDRNRECAIFGE